MTTNNSRAIARVQPGSLALEMWGQERLLVLKDQIAPGASDAELDLFAAVCQRTRLDPFAKQIWSIQRKSWNAREQREEWHQVIQLGVHGLRLVAARSGEYLGQLGPFWCGADGNWTDVWMPADHPQAAKVGVRRKGFPEPIWSVAVWQRAAQVDQRGNPQALWKTRGAEQLALAAERDALRRAFPMETAGVEAVVDAEEVAAQADQYTRIFGDEENGTVYDLDRKRPVPHAGRVVDGTTGEVLEDPPAEQTSDRFKCAECGATVTDQSGNTINDNQRELLEQRFGKVLCRPCRA